MNYSENDHYVLVRVENFQANQYYKETLFAEPLSNDLYEIKSIPKLTNTINYGDIVKAVTPSHSTDIFVTEVIVKSGYHTLHIAFRKKVDKKIQQEILYSLRKWQATHEIMCERFYVINVSPDGNIHAILNYFQGLEKRGFLIYEPDIPLEKILQIGFQ